MNIARALLAIAGLAMISVVAQAQPAAAPVALDIPAQRMQDALNALAKQAGLQVVFAVPSVEGKTSPKIHGSYTPEAALKVMLSGASLSYEFIGEKIVAIRAPRAEAVPPQREAAVDGRRWRLSETPNESGAADTNVSDGMAPENKDRSDVMSSLSGSASDVIEEILVTAQKRQERLLDVPVPVTAIDADTLASTNQLRLPDYYAKVPGLNLSVGSRGDSSIAIRGITTSSFTNPTVGVTVDDVPFGSTTSIGGGYSAPDLDPSDLERVEVLRGPQGTLYGASSMGGLIKYVTVEPDLERAHGQVESSFNHIKNGADVGYGLRGNVNVPVAEQLAFRASGFYRRVPGYIDNPVDGRDGINEQEVYGGRLSGLWQPSDVFSVKVNALFQKSQADGLPELWRLPGLTGLQQRSLEGASFANMEKQLYDATFKARVGEMNLTSITSYGVNRLQDSIDFTEIFTGFTSALFGVDGTPFAEDNKTAEEEFESAYAGWQLTSSFYRLAALLRFASIPGLELTIEAFPGERHMTVWPRAFIRGVHAVLGSKKKACSAPE